MNLPAILAIYRFEMARTRRTILQSIISPVISTSLYFVVFGAAIGSRIEEIDGISYGAFIVPGLIMLSLLTHSISNASFGIFFPKFNRTIYELLSTPVSHFEVVISYVGAAATPLTGFAEPRLTIDPAQVQHVTGIDPVGIGDLRIDVPEAWPEPGFGQILARDIPEGVPFLHHISLGVTGFERQLLCHGATGQGCRQAGDDDLLQIHNTPCYFCTQSVAVFCRRK